MAEIEANNVAFYPTDSIHDLSHVQDGQQEDISLKSPGFVTQHTLPITEIQTTSTNSKKVDKTSLNSKMDESLNDTFMDSSQGLYHRLAKRFNASESLQLALDELMETQKSQTSSFFTKYSSNVPQNIATLSNQESNGSKETLEQHSIEAKKDDNPLTKRSSSANLVAKSNESLTKMRLVQSANSLNWDSLNKEEWMEDSLDSFKKHTLDTVDKLMTQGHSSSMLYASRVAKFDKLKQARHAILTAQNQSHHAEKEQEKVQVDEFGPNVKKTGLPVLIPALHVPSLVVNDVGLIPIPNQSDLNTKAIPSIKDTKQKRKQQKHNRTNNGMSSKWIRDPDLVGWNIERGAVLEVESSEVKSKNQSPCLEGTCYPNKRNVQLQCDDDDLNIIKRLSHRVNFLKNPRYPMPKREIMELPQTSESNKQSSKPPSVVPIPSCVEFCDYVPGKVYSQTLILKNTSNSTKRFKVLTSKPGEKESPYFTIKLAKSPFEEDGNVAPGMSCSYTVTFSPDSLADYSHNLYVMSECGDQFVVPIKAKRAGPLLSLPSTLVCGPCRAGHAFITQFEFTNMGGIGNFRIMTEQETVNPFQEAKTDSFESVTESVCRMGPFEISPSSFSLAPHQSLVLVVKYSPLEITRDVTQQDDIKTLRIACDNYKIFEYQLVGASEKPKVMVKESDYLVEATDLFDGVVSFSTQNPKCTTIKTLSLVNVTGLDLQYRWHAFHYPGEHIYTKSNDAFDMGKMDELCYNISPSHGTIPAKGECQFQIAFHPQRSKLYDVVFEFIMNPTYQQDLVFPSYVPLDFQQDVLKSQPHEILSRIRCHGHGVDPVISVNPSVICLAKALYVGQEYSCELRMMSMSCSDHTFTWYLKNIDPSLVDISLSYSEDIIIKDSCLLVQVQMTGLYPGDIQGELVCQIDGIEKYQYKVPILLKVAMKPGDITFKADFIEFGAVQLGKQAHARVTLCNKANVDLQIKLMGNQRHSITQDEILASTEQESMNSLIQDEHYILYSHITSGLVPANSCLDIDLTYIPIWYQETKAMIECMLVKQDDSNAIPVTAIALHAHVETPRGRIDLLESQESAFIDCYAGTEKRVKMALVNQSQLRINYKWLPSIVLPETEPTDVYVLRQDDITVDILPLDHGALEPLETREFEVVIVCKHVGMCSHLKLSCELEGMVQDEGLAQIELPLRSKALKVDLMVFDPETGDQKVSPHIDLQQSSVIRHVPVQDHHLSLDYGDGCRIFHSYKKVLTIRNYSGIRSGFKVTVDKYPSSIAKEEDDDHEPSHDSHVSLATNQDEELGFNPVKSEMNKLGFESTQGKQYISNIIQFRQIMKRMKSILAAKKGAAFHVYPMEGVLEPYAEAHIEITSFNNLVGVYEDQIQIQLDNWMNFLIPARLQVIGLPIVFSGAQLVPRQVILPPSSTSPFTNSCSEIDRVNFGSRALVGRNDQLEEPFLSNEGPPVIVKSFQIENLSPVSIQLDWKIYVETLPLDPNTDKNRRGLVPQLPWNHMLSLMKPKNVDHQNAIFSVTPASLRLEAFGMASIKVAFVSQQPGHYTGLLTSEMGYVDKEGNVRYEPVKKPVLKLKAKDAETAKSTSQHHWIVDSIAIVQINGSKTLNNS